MAARESVLPAGSVQEFAQTVGASAVALGSNGGLQGRTKITIFNNGGGGDLFVGGPNVSTATGVAVHSNASLTLDTPQATSIYGIGSLAGTLVRTIES